ncbi:NIPSNAP family protein [Amycolatopsis sp. GM8]|uniref:NIPSNAP family protein n=1 Tax=Amycolatopsis sp. GM8 TaxID=2896530 RepID=UPI001F2F750A|nr:NIPSNAP family protein [Amycolatopsis sp. GM8]
MNAVQFRRYVIKPGAMADFLEWWRRIVPVREEHDFSLLFALQLPAVNEFVSAWRYSGPLSERERAYYADPRRRALAEESHRWAVRYAAAHGDPSPIAQTVEAGFTDGVEVRDAVAVHHFRTPVDGEDPGAVHSLA